MLFWLAPIIGGMAGGFVARLLGESPASGEEPRVATTWAPDWVGRPRGESLVAVSVLCFRVCWIVSEIERAGVLLMSQTRHRRGALGPRIIVHSRTGE